MTDQELADWKTCKKNIIFELVKFKIIPQGFSGQLTLHITQSGLGDIDVFEKGILRRHEKPPCTKYSNVV